MGKHAVLATMHSVLEQLNLVFWPQTKGPFLKADRNAWFIVLLGAHWGGWKGIPESDKTRIPVLLLVETGRGRLPATAVS